MGIREDRCRTLITEARLRDKEGVSAKSSALYGQAAALAEELGTAQIERQQQDGFTWMLDAMVFWREAGKAAQVVRVYRRIRPLIQPAAFAAKADVLVLSALHRLRSQLSFVDLSGFRLGRLDLRGADLTGTILRGSDLRGTNMQDAQLKGANLEGARLQDVNFEGANLARTYWKGSQLHRVNMQRVLLEGAYMLDAQLEGIDFTNAIMERAILNRSNMRKAILVNANLDSAKLEGTRLTMADLRRANFAHATLEDAELSGVQVDGAVFEGASIVKASMDGMFDPRSMFPGARIAGGSVRSSPRGAADRRREGGASDNGEPPARVRDDRPAKPAAGTGRGAPLKDFPGAPPEGDGREGKSIGRKLWDKFRK